MKKNFCNYTLKNLCCTLILFLILFFTYVILYFIIIGLFTLPISIILIFLNFAQNNTTYALTLIDAVNNYFGLIYNTLILFLNTFNELLPFFFSIMNIVLRLISILWDIFLTFICDTNSPKDISSCPYLLKIFNIFEELVVSILNSIILIINFLITLLTNVFKPLVCSITIWSTSCDIQSDGTYTLTFYGFIKWIYSFFEFLVNFLFYCIAWILSQFFYFVGRVDLKNSLNFNDALSIINVCISIFLTPLYFWNAILRLLDIFVVSILDAIICTIQNNIINCIIKQACNVLFVLPWPFNWFSSYVCSKFGDCPCQRVGWIININGGSSNIIKVPCEVPYPAMLSLCPITKALGWYYATQDGCNPDNLDVNSNVSKCWLSVG